MEWISCREKEEGLGNQQGEVWRWAVGLLRQREGLVCVWSIELDVEL